MEQREIAIWKGICDSLRSDVMEHRNWRPECMDCKYDDKLENTGCFLERCKIDGAPTWKD